MRVIRRMEGSDVFGSDGVVILGRIVGEVLEKERSKLEEVVEE